MEIKPCKGLFCNSYIDSLVSVTGHANFHFPVRWHEKQAENIRCTHPRALFYHLYLPLYFSTSKPVNGGQRYRSVQFMPIQKLRNSVLATYMIHIHEHLVMLCTKDGRAMGLRPLVDRKYPCWFTIASIVFAVRPSQLFRRWPPAIENADNLIDLTI